MGITPQDIGNSIKEWTAAMTPFVMNMSSTDDALLKKQREVAKASKDYMKGRISLQQLRSFEKKNSVDYGLAALQLVGLGSCLSFGLRKLRLKNNSYPFSILLVRPEKDS